MHKSGYTLFLFMLLVSSGLISLNFMFVQPVYASPGIFESHPTANTIINAIAVTTPGDAYDSNEATNAYFSYCPKDGGFEVNTFDITGPSGPITQVDFKMKYSTTISSKDDTYRIVFYVDPDATAVVLKGWTRDTTAPAIYTWADQPEPKNGTWEWADIEDIQFVVEINRQGGADSGGDFYEYEAWVTVHYTPPTSILVDPSSVTTEEGFTVNINAQTVSDLMGYTFYMRWNDTLMNVASVTEGPFLESGGKTFFVVKVYADYIYITDTLIGATVGVDGSGTLATVYFTSSKANGACDLDLYNSILLNRDMVEIPHAEVDGSFSNIGITLIPAATVSVVNPSSVNTERGFTVDVNVTDVPELHSYEFSLAWDASLFDCAAVTEGPFLKLGGATYFFLSIDKAAGTVLFKGRLYGATASVSGNGTLLTIYFTSSKANGACDLDLYTTPADFFLLDVDGNYWYHTVVDGSFSNIGITLIPAATVFVDPSSVDTVDPFSVDIKISSATEVFRWEFNLYWDIDLIDCTGVTEGTFLSVGGTTTFYYQIEEWGNVLVNCTLEGGGTAQNGSGTLATISFSGYKNLGPTGLDLYQLPTDFMLREANGMYWYHTVTGGFYEDNRPTIYVDPSLVTTTASFSVDIKIRDAVKLNFTEFRLLWDSTLINCTGIVEGSFLSGGGTTEFHSHYNNTIGFLEVNCTIVTPEGYVDGTGTVATISFSAAKASGDCDLDLYNNKLKDIFNIDQNHIVEDGYYDITPTIYVDPSLVTTTASFSVDIKIRDAVKLNFTEFRLLWDSTLINCTGIVEGSFLSGGGTTEFHSHYNNTIGFLEVNCTIVTPEGYVDGTGTVATISFSAAKASGDCDLDLYNTKLEDAFRRNVLHKVEDGYYDNQAVPEFPLGAAMEIALASAIIYLWWKRRRKSGSYNLRSL